MTLEIYTDGGCKKGFGAYAFVVVHNDKITGEYSNIEENTTNQRMELKAVISALKHTYGPVRIHTDSAYVSNCIKERWYSKWFRNGWKTTSNKPIKNKDLWVELFEQMMGRSVEIVHVRGHNGNKYNEAVDGLCSALIEAFSHG